MKSGSLSFCWSGRDMNLNRKDEGGVGAGVVQCEACHGGGSNAHI